MAGGDAVREALKGMLMGGAQGARWAEYQGNQPLDFSARIGSMSYAQACLLLAALDRELDCALPTIAGSLWRDNLSFTHNYRHYAEKAGLRTRTCQIIKPYCPPEDFPEH